MEEYKRIAASTPFELKQVVDAGNQLQALNKYSEETLINLGDLAAASGKPLEQVMSAYAKLVTGQKGEAINMFRDMLIAQSDWVDANGKALETTEEMLAELPEILERKSFVGMMDEQSKTFEGQMSNLKDSITNLGASFGEILLPTVKTVVSALTSAVDGFKNLDDGTKKIIIGIAGVAAIAGPTILGITGIIKTYNTLSAALSTATAKQLLQNAAVLANPYVLVGAAIVATTAFLAYYYVKSNDINTITNKLASSTEKLKGFTEEYKDVVKQLSDNTNDLNESEKTNLELKKAQLRLNIQDSINETLKAYGKLSEKRKKQMAEERDEAKQNKDFFESLLKDNKKLAQWAKESYNITIDSAKKRKDVEASATAFLAHNIEVYDQLDSQILTVKASTDEFINTLASAKIEKIIDDSYIEQLKAYPELYKRVKEQIKKTEATSTWEEKGKPSNTDPPVDNKPPEIVTKYSDAFDKIKADYEKFQENTKKLESGFIIGSEKAAYESENRKLQANYDAYKNYLDKQKKVENEYYGSPEQLIKYLDIKEQLYKGDYYSVEEFNKLEKDSEDIKNNYKLDSYIDYLKKKKFLTA
jgi:hypothetical protein